MSRELDARNPLHHRSPVRTMRPLYVDRLPPCNGACPAGENVQAWLAEARPAGIARHGKSSSATTRCRRFTDASATTHAKTRATARTSMRRSASTRSSGSLATRPSRKAGRSGPRAPRQASACSSSARAQRPVDGVAPGPAGPHVVIHEAGPLAGGMMHFGIPKYRLPREVLDAEIDRIRDLGVEIVLNHKVEDLMAEKAAVGSTRSSSPSGRTSSKRQDIPARDAGKIYDALQFLEQCRGRRPPPQDRPPRRDLRRRQHGDGRGAHARRLGRRAAHHLPPHARADARARLRSRRSHRRRRQDSLAADHQQIDGTTFTVEVMKLDEKGFRQPTGELETLEADSLILALGQDTDTAFLKPCRGFTSGRTARSSSDPTWRLGAAACSRVVYGAVRPDGHHRRRPRQEGGARYRRLAARDVVAAPAEARGRPAPRCCVSGITPRRKGGPTHRHRAAAPDVR